MIEQKLKQPSTGQPKPSLTRLKELPPEGRAKVMEILRRHTYEQARPIVEVATGICCLKGVLWRFFSWQAKQDARTASEDIAGQVDRFIREQNPKWTGEEVREVASKFFMLQAVQNRDVRSFVHVARTGIQREHAQLEGRRLDFQLEKLGRGSEA